MNADEIRRCIEALELEKSRLERENALWKKRYYDVADAITRESTGSDDLCRQAREIRAENARLRDALEYANRRISDGCTSDAAQAIADALSPNTQPANKPSVAFGPKRP